MPTPAPLPVIAGAYYAIIKAEANGRPISNRFTISIPGVALGDPTDASNATAVATELQVGWKANIMPDMPAAYTLLETDCYPLGSPLVPPQVVVGTGSGGVSGAQAPQSTAMVVKHTVTRRGKGSQSRTFITPIVSSVVAPDGLNLIDAEVTNFTAQFRLFILNALSAIAADVGKPALYMQLSKFHNKVYAPALYPITDSEVEKPLSTQRRRSLR